MRHARIAVPAALAAAVSLVSVATGAEPVEYLKHENTKSRTVSYRVLLYPDVKFMRETKCEPVPMENFEIVSPFVPSGATAWLDDSQAEPIRAEVVVYGQGLMDFQGPETITLTHAGAPYLSMKSSETFLLETLRLDVDVAMITSETVFDDAAAWDVPWVSSYPSGVRDWLAHDPAFDVAAEGGGDPVADLLKEWTGGNDPKQIPPVQLAKYLTAMTLKHVRVDTPASERPGARAPGKLTSRATRYSQRNPARLNLTRIIGGLNVKNAAETAATGKGSKHDLCNLLTAVLRRADVPARTVIGVDERESGTDRFRSWVEFAFMPPESREPVWVPIDMWELKSSSRGPGNWTQPWEHFGTSDELREVLPVAFYFRPPSSEHFSWDLPALYGIRSDRPLPDYGVQGIDGEVNTTPTVGGN